MANKDEAEEARHHFAQLLATNALIELKKLSPKRTLSQNNYLHLLLGEFGMHFGYTIEEAKIIYKQLNSDIYSYEKKGRSFWKSSAELSTAEMSKSIDHFRDISASNGLELPLATDKEWLWRIEKEISGNKYLKEV